ncbi:MAG: VOC family protein [Rhizobacter sp.]|nr:VOC family protein [Rhizobacter sp.]
MTTVLDHITVVAPTLVAGAKFIRDTLGVEMQQGGSHPRMGTHNLLLSLGESTYLEVIAVDPSAPKPNRPRWFDLDTLTPRSPPRLAAWVVATKNIETSASCCASEFGAIEPMTRGANAWLITIPADGGLPFGGAVPALIQWQTQAHPAKALASSGCSLVALEVFHPEPWRVSSVLQCMGLASPPRVHPTASTDTLLVAHIQTPHGLRTLSSA